MQRDYPAAHSMDTTWFAVDADGRIARFDTGEDGAVPHDAATDRGGPGVDLDVVRLLEALGAASGQEPPDDVYVHPLPGVFDYGRQHGEDPGLYHRKRAPEDRAIRIDELDEASRASLGRFRLPLRFEEASSVHLADHIADAQASIWGDSLRWPAGGPPVRRRGEPWFTLAIVLALVGLGLLAWALA